jgi:hypothetical protein
MTSTPIPAKLSRDARGRSGVDRARSERVGKMRRYDDPVEVRRGLVGEAELGESPEQFLWRGRLWKVYAVVAHWVETGPWWQSTDARAVLGAEAAAPSRSDPLGEREVWRVEAGRGALEAGLGNGVFDLSFDWAKGDWRLARCVD